MCETAVGSLVSEKVGTAEAVEGSEEDARVGDKVVSGSVVAGADVLGSRVGEDDGAIVGARDDGVADELLPIVGIAEGCDEGAPAGITLGWALGCMLGREDGCDEGIDIGAHRGWQLGWVDGRKRTGCALG